MQDLMDAIELLRSEQVNVQLEFTSDRDGYLLFELRILPWRNSAMQGYMILVAGQDIDDALIRGAESLRDRRWTQVNWRVHLNEPGVYVGAGLGPVLRSAGTRSEKASNGRESLRVIKDTSDR